MMNLWKSERSHEFCKDFVTQTHNFVSTKAIFRFDMYADALELTIFHFFFLHYYRIEWFTFPFHSCYANNWISNFYAHDMKCDASLKRWITATTKTKFNIINLIGYFGLVRSIWQNETLKLFLICLIGWTVWHVCRHQNDYRKSGQLETNACRKKKQFLFLMNSY